MKILRVDPNHPEVEAIETAAKAILDGELVIFPTETVYGLAADALNELAVRKVFEAKGRDTSSPLPVQIANVSELERVVLEVPDAAIILAKEFWPGPLTLVLYKNRAVSPILTAGTEKIGVRIPDHPVALALVKTVGRPIVATSANLSGQSPATTAEQAIASLGGSVAVVLDAGECRLRVPSTVVDVTVTPPQILRVGAIRVDAIESVVGPCTLCER